MRLAENVKSVIVIGSFTLGNAEASYWSKIMAFEPLSQFSIDPLSHSHFVLLLLSMYNFSEVSIYLFTQLIVATLDAWKDILDVGSLLVKLVPRVLLRDFHIPHKLAYNAADPIMLIV